MDELSRVFVWRVATQKAPGPFVAGLVGPSHSRARGCWWLSENAPGVDGRDLRARCLAVLQDPRLVACEAYVHCLGLIIMV